MLSLEGRAVGTAGDEERTVGSRLFADNDRGAHLSKDLHQKRTTKQAAAPYASIIQTAVHFTEPSAEDEGAAFAKAFTAKEDSEKNVLKLANFRKFQITPIIYP